MARNRAGLHFEWAEPDATIVQNKLIGLADELEDLMVPMAAAATVAQQNMETRFKTATDPSGKAWEPWAESYVPFALQHSAGPMFGDRANLHLTGDLQKEATDADAYLVTPAGLWFDTTDLPEYWAWNNFGASRSVRGASSSEADIQRHAREIVIGEFKKGRRISGQAALAKARHVASLGGKNILPERPFVGLSIVAQNKIIAIFDAWFTGVVETFQTSTGRTFARARGAGGRFKKIGE